MRKYSYLILAVLCFGAGIYLWKVKNTGLGSAAEVAGSVGQDGDRDDRGPTAVTGNAPSLTIEVGRERITQEDVNWEYELLTTDVGDQDTMTAFPDLGPSQRTSLATLRQALVATLIERKLLFAYIKKDVDFQYDNPARYTDCLARWQAAVQAKEAPELLRANKDRLKARLCERSILSQYLRERLPTVAGGAQPKARGIGPATVATLAGPSEADVVEYYKNHLAEFRLPERVRIRHILLGSELEARKWRAQANAHNFETLAREHSLAPEASRGGLLGPYAKGAMPAVFELAFHLQKGQISDVLKSNYGYHIIMLIDHEARQDSSLERARPKIVAALRSRQRDEAYGKLIEQALTSITVKTPQKFF